MDGGLLQLSPQEEFWFKQIHSHAVIRIQVSSIVELMESESCAKEDWSPDDMKSIVCGWKALEHTFIG
jgi:hypothetical protein